MASSLLSESTWNPQFWIGVDLDGTLFEIVSDKPPYPIGPIIPAMFERVKRWLKEGKTVKILTARNAMSRSEVDSHGQPSSCYPEEQTKIIQDALLAHGLFQLKIVNHIDPYCVEIWNDRAVQVSRNKGTVARYQQSVFGESVPYSRCAELFAEIAPTLKDVPVFSDSLEMNDALWDLLNDCHNSPEGREKKVRALAILARHLETCVSPLPKSVISR